jgi:NitT/TauT family transport system substrate-binding protein
MNRATGRSVDRIDRRRFLANTAALGAASLLGVPGPAAAEPPLETSRLRLVKIPAICLAPQFLAAELLKLEGFSEVEYVGVEQTTGYDPFFENNADITGFAPPNLLPFFDAGKPVVALAGLHGGCYELFAHESIRTVRDLKGKRVAVTNMEGVEYYYVASIAAYVGIDPRKDIHWVDAHSFTGMMKYFIDRKVDAFLAFPPQPQELRARRIGRVIVNTTQDRPWDQYYCCMIAARKEFVAKNPIATKRAVRAILKATDICAREPERAARYMVDAGFEARYDVALDVVQSLSYNRWRSYDPEDSLRFFGVRLHEAGLIKTSPQKLITQGTDWRFLNELKRELKA